MEIKTTKQLEPVEYWRSLRKKDYLGKAAHKMDKLTDFIDRNLQLCDFIPSKLVNGKWEVLEKPNEYNYKSGQLDQYINDLKEYQEAESKVLFKVGIKEVKVAQNSNSILKFGKVGYLDYNGNVEFFDRETIQDIIHLDLELTQAAKKQL